MSERRNTAGRDPLPEPATGFIGREAELSALGEALSGPRRLVTLVGPGGIGKTRLAVRAASAWQAPSRRPDWFGPVFAPLAAVEEPQSVEAAVLDAAAIRPQSGRLPLNAMIDHVGERQGLLVLDNCEHLVEAAGDVVESLLEGCPGLRVLATSREPLGVPGEAVWQVPPLPTGAGKPGRGAKPDRDAKRHSDAARLFLDRAAAAGLADPLPADAHVAVEHIVHELDGMPLAIELAAARARTLSPSGIAEELDGWILAAHDAERPARHRSMRRALDWSHQFLSPEEAVLFRRLSVFAGGWTLAAAEHVCGDAGVPGVHERLLGLIDKSLVEVNHGPRGTRYRMLLPIRQYAAERLAADEPADAPDGPAARHRAWYLDYAERADRELLGFTDDGRADLDAEAPNVRAALDHACRAGSRDALRIAGALGSYWRAVGRYAEGARAVGHALAAAPDTDGPDRALALAMHGTLTFWMGDLAGAQRDSEAAEAMAVRVGDARARAHALARLGTVRMMMDPPIAQPLLARAVEAARAVDDLVALGDAMAGLSTSHVWQDDFPGMERVAAEGASLAGRVGYDAAVFWTLWGRAHKARLAADPEEARRLAQEAFEASDMSESLVRNAIVEPVALIHVMTGDAQEARRMVRAELDRSRDDGVRWGIEVLHHALGVAELALGNRAEARALGEQMWASERDGAGYLAWHGQEVLMLAALGDGDHAAARKHAELLGGVATRLGNRRAEGVARIGLARAALLAGNTDAELADAETLAHAALAPSVAENWWVDAMSALEVLAVVAARRKRHDRAIRLFLGVVMARAERGLIRVPGDETWWDAEFRETLAGFDDPNALLAEGGIMPLAQLAEFTTRGRGTRGRPDFGPDSLTPMQLNVVRLAARGASNVDIAAELFIARGTVKTHLAQAFAKLGVHNRTELAALGLGDITSPQ